MLKLKEDDILTVRKNFVGREKELEKLRQYIHSSSRKKGALLRIWGPGGIGKSFLVIKAYTEFHDHPGGHVCLGMGDWEEKQDTEKIIELMRDFCAEVKRLPHTGNVKPIAIWSDDEISGLAKKQPETLIAQLAEKLAELSTTIPVTLIFDEFNWLEENRRDLYRLLVEKLITPAKNTGAVVVLVGRYPAGRNPLGLPYEEAPHFPEPFNADIHLKRFNIEEVKLLVQKLRPEPEKTLQEYAERVFHFSQGYPSITDAIITSKADLTKQDTISERRVWKLADKAFRAKFEIPKKINKVYLRKFLGDLVAFRLVIDAGVLDAYYEKFLIAAEKRIEMVDLSYSQMMIHNRIFGAYEIDEAVKVFLSRYQKSLNSDEWNALLEWAYNFFLKRAKEYPDNPKREVRGLFAQTITLMEEKTASLDTFKTDLDVLTNIKFDLHIAEQLKRELKSWMDYESLWDQHQKVWEIFDTWLDVHTESKIQDTVKSEKPLEQHTIKNGAKTESIGRPARLLFPKPNGMIGLRNAYLKKIISGIETGAKGMIHIRGQAGVGKTEFLLDVLTKSKEIDGICVPGRSENILFFDFSDPGLLNTGNLFKEILAGFDPLADQTHSFQMPAIWDGDIWAQKYNLLANAHRLVVLGFDSAEMIDEKSALYAQLKMVLPRMENSLFIFCERPDSLSLYAPSPINKLFPEENSIGEVNKNLSIELDIFDDNERREYIARSLETHIGKFDLKDGDLNNISKLSQGHPVMLSVLLGLPQKNVNNIYDRYNERSSNDTVYIEQIAYDEICRGFFEWYLDENSNGAKENADLCNLAIVAHHGITDDLLYYVKKSLKESITHKNCANLLSLWTQENTPLVKYSWGKQNYRSVTFHKILNDYLTKILQSHDAELMHKWTTLVINYYETKLSPGLEQNVESQEFASSLIQTMSYRNFMMNADTEYFFKKQSELARRRGQWHLVEQLRRSNTKEFQNKQNDFCKIQDIQHSLDMGKTLEVITLLKNLLSSGNEVQKDFLLETWLGYQEISIKRNSPGTLGDKAWIELHDAYQKAEQLLWQFTEVHNSWNVEVIQGDLYKKLAELSFIKERYDWVEKYLQRAVALYAEQKVWPDMIGGLAELAKLELKRGRLSMSWRYLAQASEIVSYSGPRGKALYQSGLASVHLAQGNPEKTLSILDAPFFVSFSGFETELYDAQITVTMAKTVQLSTELLSGQDIQDAMDRFWKIAGRYQNNHGSEAGNHVIERIDRFLEAAELAIYLCDSQNLRASQNFQSLLNRAEESLQNAINLLDAYKSDLSAPGLLSDQPLRKARAFSAMARLLIWKSFPETPEEQAYVKYSEAKEALVNAWTLFKNDHWQNPSNGIGILDFEEEHIKEKLITDFQRAEVFVNLTGGFLQLQSEKGSIQLALDYFSKAIEFQAYLSSQWLQELNLNHILNALKNTKSINYEIDRWLLHNPDEHKKQFADLLKQMRLQLTWETYLPHSKHN